MLQQIEIVAFFCGALVLFFSLHSFRQFFYAIPHYRLLLTGFLFLFGTEITTNLEALIWPDVMNFIEHLCHLLSTGVLIIWIYLVGIKPEREHS